MIVLEGLDNTGKTTLAERLLAEFPQLTYRPSIGNKHKLAEISDGIEYEAMFDTPFIISDRSRIISEYIYNPVLKRRPPVMGFETWMTYVSKFCQGDHLIIYCWLPMEVLDRTFADREQLPGVLENLPTLNLRYRKMMGMLDLLFTLNGRPNRVVAYNWKSTDAFTPSRAVRKYLKGE